MSAVDRVEKILKEHQLACEIKYLDETAHTADQAAKALGCDVCQIVKSLIFKTRASAQPVLALVSGDKRADLKSFSAILGESLDKADADFVKTQTGFTIGGVAPIGSINTLPVYIDKHLFQHQSVWAAAGHPKTVFNIDPKKLAELADAQEVDITS